MWDEDGPREQERDDHDDGWVLYLYTQDLFGEESCMWTYIFGLSEPSTADIVVRRGGEGGRVAPRWVG